MLKKKKVVSKGVPVKKKTSTRDKMKQRSEDLKKKGSGGGYKYFIFKDGVSRMRPLPIKEDVEPGVEVVFFYVSKDAGGFISPITFSEPCAYMEKYEELKRSKDEDDQALAKSMAPKRRYMVMHIKYKDEKGTEVDDENGAKLALLTNQQYQDLCDMYLDDEAGDFTDPVSGYDIKYKRSGKGMMDTVYSTLACKPTKLPKRYNKVYDPEAEVRNIIPSYEETEELLSQFLKVPSEGPKKKKTSSSDEVKKKKKKIKRDL